MHTTILTLSFKYRHQTSQRPCGRNSNSDPPPPKRTKYFKPSPRHHPRPSARESDAQTIAIQGPLGKLEIDVPPFIWLRHGPWTLDWQHKFAELESQGELLLNERFICGCYR